MQKKLENDYDILHTVNDKFINVIQVGSPDIGIFVGPEKLSAFFDQIENFRTRLFHFSISFSFSLLNTYWIKNIN